MENKGTHLIALRFDIRLEETVLNEPVAHFRVVPTTESGRLGARVVLIEQLFILVLFKLGGFSGAAGDESIISLVAATEFTHMTPSETSHWRI